MIRNIISTHAMFAISFGIFSSNRTSISIRSFAAGPGYCEIGQCLDKFTGLFALNGIDLSAYPKINQWRLGF